MYLLNYDRLCYCLHLEQKGSMFHSSKCPTTRECIVSESAHLT